MTQQTPNNGYWLPEPGDSGWLQMQNENWELADTIPPAEGQITTGTMSFSGGPAAPTGWLICDGRELVITEHPALAAYLGPAYAASQTTFHLPDLRGRFVCGPSQDQSLGTTGGANTVTLSDGNLPTHTHSVDLDSAGGHTHKFERKNLNQLSSANVTSSNYHPALSLFSTFTATTSSIGGHTHGITMQSYGAGTAHENRPPFIALHIIIKT